MEEFNGYDSFIFYRGWAETAKGFAEDFGEDFAKEMIWALICYVCFGEIVTEKKSIIKWIEGDCLRVIQAAKKRHDDAIESGKLGGRPSKINKDEVLSLKQDGKTVKEIAEILGCSRDGIEKILNGSRQTDKPPTNLYVNEDDNENANDYTNANDDGSGLAVPPKSANAEKSAMGQKGQNHDIDKDIDKDKETDIERGGSDEPPKSANAGKSADAEVKLKVIQLFKKKYKYAEIQKSTGLSFDEINSIIKDKERWNWWENEVEQSKAEERARKQREKQKAEEDNMLKLVQEHCEEDIDEEEVLRHYRSDTMSDWDYLDLVPFLEKSNKKYARFRDLSNEIQHDKNEAFKSYPY